MITNNDMPRLAITLAKDFRVTSQRKVILNYLRNTKGHVSAEEVYRGVKQKLPHLSFGTVYRNLEFLTRRGLIREFFVDHISHYEGRVDAHIHFRCQSCRRIFDIEKKDFFREKFNLLKNKGFLVQNQLVEFSGLCQDCLKKKSNILDKELYCIAGGHLLEEIDSFSKICQYCVFQENCVYLVKKK